MEPNLFPTGPRATIRPWVDPVVDHHGFDPRSPYVEFFWLGVIGPTATWLMRRFAAGFEREPGGFALDLADTAAAMGLSFSRGAASPFGKALHRCIMFGLALPTSDGFTVRRRIPQVPRRHLRRMPGDVQRLHEQWIRAGDATPAPEAAPESPATGVGSGVVSGEPVHLPPPPGVVPVQP